MPGSWSPTPLYILIGLVGGTVAGVLDASRQMVERRNKSSVTGSHTLPALNRSADTTGRDVSTVRQEYETLVDHSVAQARRRLRHTAVA